MIISFLKAFGLQENSPIFHYISLILHEHEKFLQKILETNYVLFDAKLRENLRDGTILLSLAENEKFENILESLGGSEFILQLYFDHPDSKIFD